MSYASDESARSLPRRGTDFGFGFEWIPAEDRLRAVRDAGFDDVMLWWGMEWAEKNGTPKELFDRALAAGLQVHTAHFPTDQTPHCWREGPEGDDYERALLSALRDCGERGIENLVVHTTRKLVTPPPSEIGLGRFLRAAEAAEKYGVDIALENTRFPAYNAYLYDRISSPRLRFCFDSGHAFCFTPDQDPLGRFGSRLVTMHLHDNHGSESGDEHLIPGDGAIDFATLMPRIHALAPRWYNLECRVTQAELRQGVTMHAYLQKAALALDRLLALRTL